MGFLLKALQNKGSGNLSNQLRNLERRLGSVGMTPPEPEPGLVRRTFDILLRPQYAVMGLLKELAQPGERFEPLAELGKGIRGETQTSGKELMQILGMSDKPLFQTQLNVGQYRLPIAPSPAGVAGFAADVFADPLTYLSLGAGGALKGGLRLSTKSAPLLSKLPEKAIAIPGTKAAAQALDKTLDITGNLAKFRQGFTQATRGFAPAGQTIRVVKEGMDAVPSKTTKTLVPDLMDALKPPVVSGLPEAQTVDLIEEGLRQLYRSNKIPTASVADALSQTKAAIGSAKTVPFPDQQLSQIADTLGMSGSDVLKAVKEAGKRGISEDSFVRSMTKAIRPTEAVPEGMKLRSVTERAKQAIPDEVSEYSAPLKGSELLGYKVGSNKLVQAFGEAFKPYFGLHAKAAKAARGAKRELALREEEILNRAQNIVKIAPNEIDRIAITKWLDDPVKNALPRNLEQIGNIIKQRFENIGRSEQEAGLLEELWDTYVTHIYKNDPAVINKALNKWSKMQQKPISTALGFAKERALPTLEAAKKLGLTPEYDIAKILAIRELASARAMSGVNFVNEIKKLPYLVTSEAIAPPDFVKVVGIKGLEGLKVAPDVGRFLTKMQNVFGDNKAMNAFLKEWDRFSVFWKAYATVTNPGFHFRNMFGNFFNNWLADVNEKMYGVARNVINGADGKIGDYTFDQVRQLAKQHGVDAGFFGTDLRKLTRDGVDALTQKSQSLNPLSPDFAPIKAGRALGESIETNARMAHFVDRLVKGEGAEQAAESVMKYLFDYGDLTRFESQALRRVAPFYTWTRKNIPLQLEMLLTKPGKYATVAKTAGAIEDSAGGRAQDEPEWVRESGAITTPITDDTGRLLLLPRMPYEDLNKITPGKTLESVTSMTNPLIKVLWELAANKQIFSGQPIEKFKGEQVPFGPAKLPARAAYVARQIPFLSNIERLTQEERGDRRVLDLLSTLAGVKFYQEEPARQGYQFERIGQLQELIRLLEQQGTNVPTIAELESMQRRAMGKKKTSLADAMRARGKKS